MDNRVELNDESLEQIVGGAITAYCLPGQDVGTLTCTKVPGNFHFNFSDSDAVRAIINSKGYDVDKIEALKAQGLIWE